MTSTEDEFLKVNLQQPENVLVLTRYEIGGAAKTLLEIKNIHGTQNIAYKIKTTAPKQFVVKPIQGVIPPGMSAACKVSLVFSNVTDKQSEKNKFMIQSAFTDLKPTETQMIAGFWEHMKTKDKKLLKQTVISLKIGEIIDPKLRKTIDDAMSNWSARISDSSLMSKFTAAQNAGHESSLRRAQTQAKPANLAETLSEIQSSHSEAGELASEYDEKALNSGRKEKLRTQQNTTSTTGVVDSARTQKYEKSNTMAPEAKDQEEVKQESKGAAKKVPPLNIEQMQLKPKQDQVLVAESAEAAVKSRTQDQEGDQEADFQVKEASNLAPQLTFLSQEEESKPDEAPQKAAQAAAVAQQITPDQKSSPTQSREFSNIKQENGTQIETPAAIPQQPQVTAQAPNLPETPQHSQTPPATFEARNFDISNHEIQVPAESAPSWQPEAALTQDHLNPNSDNISKTDFTTNALSPPVGVAAAASSEAPQKQEASPVVQANNEAVTTPEKEIQEGHANSNEQAQPSMDEVRADTPIPIREAEPNQKLRVSSAGQKEQTLVADQEQHKEVVERRAETLNGVPAAARNENQGEIIGQKQIDQVQNEALENIEGSNQEQARRLVPASDPETPSAEVTEKQQEMNGRLENQPAPQIENQKQADPNQEKEIRTSPEITKRSPEASSDLQNRPTPQFQAETVSPAAPISQFATVPEDKEQAPPTTTSAAPTSQSSDILITPRTIIPVHDITTPVNLGLANQNSLQQIRGQPQSTTEVKVSPSTLLGSTPSVNDVGLNDDMENDAPAISPRPVIAYQGDQQELLNTPQSNDNIQLLKSSVYESNEEFVVSGMSRSQRTSSNDESTPDSGANNTNKRDEPVILKTPSGAKAQYNEFTEETGNLGTKSIDSKSVFEYQDSREQTPREQEKTLEEKQSKYQREFKILPTEELTTQQKLEQALNQQNNMNVVEIEPLSHISEADEKSGASSQAHVSSSKKDRFLAALNDYEERESQMSQSPTRQIPEQIIRRDTFDEGEKREVPESAPANYSSPQGKHSPLAWQPTTAAPAASPPPMTLQEAMANNLTSTHQEKRNQRLARINARPETISSIYAARKATDPLNKKHSVKNTTPIFKSKLMSLERPSLRMSLDSTMFSVQTVVDKKNALEVYHDIQQVIRQNSRQTKQQDLEIYEQEVLELEKELHELQYEQLKLKNQYRNELQGATQVKSKNGNMKYEDEEAEITFSYGAVALMAMLSAMLGSYLIV